MFVIFRASFQNSSKEPLHLFLHDYFCMSGASPVTFIMLDAFISLYYVHMIACVCVQTPYTYVCLCCVQTPYTVAIMYVGAPACGMNAAARAFVRMGLNQGCKVLGIRYGFEGLLQNDVSTRVHTVRTKT